jgi:osmotically inducible lipoprotein OsmB
MQRKISLIALMGLISLGMAACGDDPGTRAVTGGLMGAGVGAGAAAVTGGRPATGAAIGAGVGAVGGALTTP